jgi:hypothetical protein
MICFGIPLSAKKMILIVWSAPWTHGVTGMGSIVRVCAGSESSFQPNEPDIQM